MNIPVPEPGLVIRYVYLWKREADSGRDEGSKDRPCAVVLAFEDKTRRRVFVVPITHSMPQPPQVGIEIPQSLGKRLALEAARSWVIVSEANLFLWPGPDLRPISDQHPGTVAYGFLPPRFFNMVRQSYIALARAGRVLIVERSA